MWSNNYKIKSIHPIVFMTHDTQYLYYNLFLIHFFCDFYMNILYLPWTNPILSLIWNIWDFQNPWGLKYPLFAVLVSLFRSTGQFSDLTLFSIYTSRTFNKHIVNSTKNNKHQTYYILAFTTYYNHESWPC